MISVSMKSFGCLFLGGMLVVFSLFGCSGSAGDRLGYVSSGVTGGEAAAAASTPAGEAEVAAVTLAGEAEVAGVTLEQVDLAGIGELVAANPGKLILVDVWSTACIPCMQEFPNLVELSRKYPDELMCISLNVDYIGLKAKPPESYRAKVLGFLEKQAAASVVNFLASQPDTEVLEGYGVESMPAIVLYGREGEILEKFTDANSGEDGLSYEGDVIPRLLELLPAK